MEGAQEAIAVVAGVVPSRARLIGRFISATTFTSVTFGLFAGQIGVLLPCGPLIPFMTGAWCGYTLGAITFWKAEVGRAMSYVELYPRLVEHVMDQRSWVTRPSGLPLREWISCADTVTRIGRQSWVALASQDCIDMIEDMKKEERSRIIEEYLNPTSTETEE
jgi:hypothetical protein|eukprot:m.12651 g.12651  ORF g.12651 m.12651 type:complete len:163 (-) comp7857_c0_seq1:209-697(-)